MVSLDALSEYWIASHHPEEKALNVTLSSVGRSGFKSHLLQLNNHQVKGLEEELKVTPPPGVAVGFELSCLSSAHWALLPSPGGDGLGVWRETAAKSQHVQQKGGLLPGSTRAL